MYEGLYEYLEFNSGASVSCFRPEIPFLWKFGPKNQNCYLRLKFNISAALNMESSIVMLTFTVLDWKYPFWANVVQKSEIVISS